MSNKKLSDLTTASYPLTGTEYLLAIQNNQSVKIPPGIITTLSTGDGVTPLQIQPTGGDITIGSPTLGFSSLKIHGNVSGKSVTLMDSLGNDIGSITAPASNGYLRWGDTGFIWDGSVAQGATRNVYRGAWVTGTAYIVGDLVTGNSGIGWICILNHTSNNTDRTLPTTGQASNAYWDTYVINGSDAKLYNIVTSSPVIVKDSPDAATSGTHSVVTIQGKKVVGNTTTNYGFITVTANGGTESGTATDTSLTPITLSPANGDGKLYYTIKMYDTTNKTTLLDTQTIYVVFKGATGSSNVVIDLNNDNTSVPAGPDGSVSSFANAVTTASVYYGSADDSANWTFSQTYSSGLTATASNSNRTATVTALSTDSGYIDFTATRAGYATQTARFTVTKQKTGATGTNGAQYVVVNGDQVFMYNSGATVPVTTTIIASASLYGGLTSYSWQYWTGSTWSPLSGTNNASTYSLAYDNAAWSTNSLRIRCISDIYFDEITIVKVYAGTNAVTGLLTNETCTIPTLNDGTGGVYTSAGGTFKVWDGTTDKTGNVAVTYSVQSSSVGLTISINSSGVYTASLISAVDTGTATLRAVYNGVTIDKLYTIAKSKQGAIGYSAVTIDLTNDVSTIPTDSAGNSGNFTNAVTTASIYLGNIDDSANWTFTQSVSSGLTVTASNSNRTATVTALSVDTGYVDFTASKSGYPNQVIRYNVTKAKAGVTGTPATVNYIELSSPTIKKDKNGNYNPTSSIIAYGKQIVGNAAPASYSGIFKVYTQATVGGAYTLVATSTSVTSYTYTFPTSNVIALKIEMYDPTGTTLYDYEIIPYLLDGSDVTSYDIITSSPVITKQAPDAATSGVHSSITIQGKRYIGADSANYGFITVTPNGGTEATTATDTSVTPITLSPADADGKLYYTIKMYNQATVSGAVLHDSQIVYVIFKGATGATGAAGINGTNGLDAKYVVVNGDQAFKFLAGSSTPVSSSIVLTASLFGGITGYQWQYYSAGTWTNISGATLQTYTVAYNDATLWAGNPQSIRIRCLSTTSYYDEITIVKLYDGANGTNGTNGVSSVTGLLTNESAVVGTLPDGTNGDYTSSGGTFKVWEGTTDKTGMGIVGGYGLTYSVLSYTTGLSISIAQTGVYTIASLTADTASATLRAVYTKSDGTNVTIDKIYSIAKSKTGKSPITIAVTNENHTLPADQNGTVTSYANSGTKIYVYEGADSLIYDGVGTTAGTWKVTISATNITAGSITALNDGTGGISVADSTAITSTVATIQYTISGTTKLGSTFTYIKVQSVNKANAGKNAIIKYLDLQYSVVSKSSAGVFNPASTFPIKAKQIENNVVSDYITAVFRITPSTGTVVTTSAGASYDYTYSPSITFFKIELFDSTDTGFTTVLDTEIIPFVADGVSSITAVLSNDNASIATDASGTVVANGYNNTGTDIRVYEGATELSYDGVGTSAGTWKVTATGANITPNATITDSGTYATIGIASNVIADVSTITFNIVGKTIAGLDFTATKVQTFNKSKQGVQGNTGNTGAAGPGMFISSNKSLVFTSTNGIIDSGQTDIILTVNTAGMSGQTYAWSFSGFQTTPTNSGAASQTITAAQFGTAISAIATVTVTYNSVSYTSSCTITRYEKINTAFSGTTNPTPSSPSGAIDGDSYFNTTTNILWYKTNGTWSRVLPVINNTNVTTFFSDAAIGNAQIGNLDAGKITTGTLSASTDITVGSATEGLIISGTETSITGRLAFSISAYTYTSWYMDTSSIVPGDSYSISYNPLTYGGGVLEIGQRAYLEYYSGGVWTWIGTYVNITSVNALNKTVTFDTAIAVYGSTFRIWANKFTVTGTVTGPAIIVGSKVDIRGVKITLSAKQSDTVWFTNPKDSYNLMPNPLYGTGSVNGSIEKVKFGLLSNTKYGIEGFDSIGTSLFKLDETGLTAKITESSINSVGGSYNFPVVAKGSVTLSQAGTNAAIIDIPVVSFACMSFLIQVTGYYINATNTASASNMTMAIVGAHYNRATSNWSAPTITGTTIANGSVGSTSFSSSKITTGIVAATGHIQLTLTSFTSQAAGASSTYSYVVWAIDNNADKIFKVY